MCDDERTNDRSVSFFGIAPPPTTTVTVCKKSRDDTSINSWTIFQLTVCLSQQKMEQRMFAHSKLFYTRQIISVLRVSRINSIGGCFMYQVLNHSFIQTDLDDESRPKKFSHHSNINFLLQNHYSLLS
jgi:hypothetical protein